MLKKLAATVQVAMRPGIKSAMYKKLYGGDLTIYEKCARRFYARIPNAHPIAKATLEQPCSDFNYIHPQKLRREKASRRHLLLLSLVLAAILLSGCAHFDVDEKWEAAPSHKPLPHIYFKVNNLEQTCGWQPEPGRYLYGCAQRNYHDNVCIIFYKHELTSWQREHEEKHCAGYNHEIVGAVRTARSF